MKFMLHIKSFFQSVLDNLIVFAFVVIFVNTTFAQIAGNNSTPLAMTSGRPSGSYQFSEIENINYFNGRVNITIPLANAAGRGSNNYPINFSLSSPHWKTDFTYTYNNAGEATLLSYLSDEPLGKVLGGTQLVSRFMYDYVDTPNGCVNTNAYHFTLTRIYATMPDGTEHELRDTATDGRVLDGRPCGTENTNRGRIFVSKDGTFMTFVADNDIWDNYEPVGYHSGTLYLKDGSSFRTNGIYDKNGNITSVTGNPTDPLAFDVTDSIKRTTTIQPDLSFSNQAFVKYKGGDNQDRQTSVNTSTLANVLAAGETLKSTNQLFNNFFVGGGGNDGTYDPKVISSVTLPNGLSYQFKYNSFGEIARVELPTGGAIEYSYDAGISDSTSGCIVGGADYGEYHIYRRVVERRTYDDGVNLTSRTTIGRPLYETNLQINNHGYVDVKIYAPQLIGHERHFFYGEASWSYSHRGIAYQHWKIGKEYRTEILSPQDQSILRAVNKEWQQNAVSWCSNCGDESPENNPRVVETTTELLDVSPKLVSRQTSIDPANPSHLGFDQFNNPTDTWEYDWGVNAPGQFLRRTHADYLTDPGYTSHTGSHIRNLPLETWVSSDAAGNSKHSLTKFEYDNYNSDDRHAPLIPRTTATGHDAAFDEQYIKRGNVTKITSYSDAANQADPVIVSSKYDVLGNVVETKDGRGNVTTISYDDRFGLPDGEARANSQQTGLGNLRTFAFPTSATNVLGWTSYAQFDYFTGQAVNTEDVNGVISKTIYNDSLDRPTQTVTAVGTPFEGQSSTLYEDNAHKVTVTSDLKALNDNLLKSESLYDGLGRTIETHKYENGGSDFITTKTIPFLVMQDTASGRWLTGGKTSNPYRAYAGEQPVWTTNVGDSKLTKTITPDSATVKSERSGNTVTVTDQAGKQRRSITNALGQLKRVDEPTAAGLGTITSPNQSTNYSYDALGNLTTVVQGGQTRSFVYDSLSRLKSAQNPESGTIQYSYDANGNLQTKIAARAAGLSIKTVYAYDNLNRVTLREYRQANDAPLPAAYATPSVEYFYDGLYQSAAGQTGAATGAAKGKLTGVKSSVSVTNYIAFDALGRILESSQETDGQTFRMGYSYNLAGMMVSERYPSGRIVRNEFDADGDLQKVASQRGGAARTFASNFAYTAAGAVERMQIGNGRWETTLFNNRLQPTQLGLGTTNSTSAPELWQANFEYGTMNGDGTVLVGTNNGNVAKQTITVPGVTTNGTTAAGFTAVQRYGYDSLNRISIASENLTLDGSSTVTGYWQQNFSYDRFGNRRFDYQTNGGTSVPSINPNNPQTTPRVVNPEIDPANNRLKKDQDGVTDAYLYDSAGNLTRDAAGKRFEYDAENKQIRFFQAGNASTNAADADGKYLYDGDGMRVKKVGDVGEITIFVYDAGGRMVAEYSNHTAANTAPQTSYLTNDHLGSPRVITDQTGKVTSRRDFLPFGEEINAATMAGNGAGMSGRGAHPDYAATDKVRQKFTGYEKDGESDLDFAQARYYSSKHGRFTSVDPLLWSASSSNPKTWNRYIYSLNNPLNLTDSTGLSANCPPLYPNCQTDNNGNFIIDDKTGEKSYVNDEASIVVDSTDRQRVIATGMSVIPPPATQEYCKRDLFRCGDIGILPGGMILPAGPIEQASGGVISRALSGIAKFFGFSVRTAEFANGVTRAALQAAAADTGPTIKVVTNLTQSPLPGRALSVAVGEGAEALAGTARSGGTTFTARIPKALIENLRTAGLVEERTTLMGGAQGKEFYFDPKASEFIVNFFKQE